MNVNRMSDGDGYGTVIIGTGGVLLDGCLVSTVLAGNGVPTQVVIRDGSITPPNTTVD